MPLPAGRQNAISKTRIRDPRDVETVLQVGEVVDPMWFFGREEEVTKVLEVLAHPEQTGVIYGERGVGKSSLGHLVQSLAGGDLAPLDYYGGRERLETTRKGLFGTTKVAPLSFETVRLVASRDDVLDNVYYQAAVAIQTLLNNSEKLEQLHVELGATVLGSGGTVKVGFQRAHNGLPPMDTGGRGRFDAAVSDFTSKRKDATLLVVIDEFDQVADGAKLAEQLKKHPRLKFVLIGIADQLAELVAEHASTPRVITPIHVRPMTEIELTSLVDGICLALATVIEVPLEVRSRLVQVSDGSPYVCKSLVRHLLNETIKGVGDLRELGDPLRIDGRRLSSLLSEVTRVFPGYEQVYLSLINPEPKMTAKILRHVVAAPDFGSVEIGGVLGDVHRSDVGKYLDWLHERAILAASPMLFGTRRMKFSDPGLRRYIRLRAVAEDTLVGLDAPEFA